MSDQPTTPEVQPADTASDPEQAAGEQPQVARVFKIGANRVVEDASTANLTNEQVRSVLQAAYPEVAHATIRERLDAESGLRIVEYLPVAGRKG